MRNWILGASLAVLSTGALAQETDWKFYEPDDAPMQAIALSKDGSRLILKCDKPGKQKVFAVVVANSNLAAPMPDDQYESRPVTLRMDESAAWEDNWRVNDRFAMAVDQGNTRSLTRLLEKLAKADKVELRLKPIRRNPVVIEYETTGARNAIEMVYASCEDTIPFD